MGRGEGVQKGRGEGVQKGERGRSAEGGEGKECRRGREDADFQNSLTSQFTVLVLESKVCHSLIFLCEFEHYAHLFSLSKIFLPNIGHNWGAIATQLSSSSSYYYETSKCSQ